MKTAQSRLSQASDLRAKSEAALEEHIAEIFRRIPVLAGFAIRDDYEFDDVSAFGWPGYTVDEELYQELVEALSEFADERPDAAKLLHGRTFARAFH
jgi:hypothetical protein